ncbi:MAG TPA: APC family permease [Actinomycetota bacterium]|nr:APC family permease [Actinomycetota bacterium]
MATTLRGRPPVRELVKRLLVGRALATHKQEHQLLPKFLALPVFSSDPLSSNAYATEEMMLVLVLAGAGALSLKLPIALAIAALLLVVVTSYRQTVRAYPRGGGSYIVARENLGTVPGLVAAAAILSDYVLTVAVSITAGTIAITSALPGLAEHRVAMAVALVGLVSLANLRGVREAGMLFAVPTYGFVAMVGITLLTGLARCLGGCPLAETADLPLAAEAPLTAFLVLRAFASGSTALTGVEAIADGVGAFRRPQARNAAATLAIMGAMSVTMFLGITWLAQALHVRTNEEIALHTSVLAQIGETVFGGGPLFAALQATTAGILVLAANTAYQDFPRLSSILARDRFMPAQFRNRGDRLVFSNGVIALALLAILLIWAFDAELTRLIQLYVVGVFTAFTLSQAGMVRRWLRQRTEGWRRSAVINGVGAVVTGIVLVIVTITKFTRGAWIVIAAIPVIVSFFVAVQRHYERIGRLLRARQLSATAEAANTFVLLVQDVGPATADAVAYLLAVRPERVVPLYVGPSDRFGEHAEAWAASVPRLGPLEPLPGAAEHPVRALRAYLRSIPRRPDDFITVVIPEEIPGRSLLAPLGARRALVLKTSLLFEPGVVVTNVPLLPQEVAEAAAHLRHPVEPRRSVVLVPVAAVHDATARALIYAKSLRPAVLEAVSFVTDPEEAGPLVEEWHRRRIDVPLALVEAPFRDLGPPLLEEIRSHTGRGDTIVTVVLPEFVVDRWWEQLLHNQTAFYFKRLLLFEPRVVVTSVPYHLAPGAMSAGAGDPAGRSEGR